MEEKYSGLDEALAPLHEMIVGLSAVGDDLISEEAGVRMFVEQLSFRLPVEIEVLVNEEGKVTVGMAPPTQIIETTVMPVWHNIKLNVVRTDEDAE